MSAYRVVSYTSQGEEPVTVAEARAFCQLDPDADTADLTLLIPAVRDVIERLYGLALTERTIEVSYDREELQRVIEVPVSPLVTLRTVAFADVDDVETQLDAEAMAALLRANVLAQPGELILKAGQAWPTDLRREQALTLTAVVGWKAETLPPGLKLALLKTLATNYDHRSYVLAGGEVQIPEGAARDLAPYKVWTL